MERRTLESIGIRGDHKVRDFLRGHAFGLAGISGIVVVMWITGGVRLVAAAPVFFATWVSRADPALGWHAGWNWLLAVGFGLPVTGLGVGIPALLADMEPVGPFWLTGGAQGPEASVACLGYFAVGIAWMLAQARNRNKIAPIPMP